MPIRANDPRDNADHQEHEDEDNDPVGEREGVAAVGGDGAGDEPEDVEEDGDYEEEGERGVDDLFGVMPERPEEEEDEGDAENSGDYKRPDQVLEKGRRRRRRRCRRQ